jgi:hypothetical protein
MQENEEEKRQERRDFLEEGRLLRKKQTLEKQKLERIKQKKLGNLKGLNIPTKYQADLEKKKIE